MPILVEKNGVQTLEPKKIIFYEGLKAKTLNIVTKGEIDVFISSKEILGLEDEEEIISDSYKIFSIPKNMFIGMEDLIMESTYTFTFKTKELSEIYFVKIPDKSHIVNFFNSNKSYVSNMQHSLAYFINKAYEAYLKIKKIHNQLKITTNNLGVIFHNSQSKGGYLPKSEVFKKTKIFYEDSIKQGFNFPSDFDIDFINQDHSDIYENRINLIIEDPNDIEKRIDFYKRLLAMPANIKSQFFSFDIYLSVEFAIFSSENLQNIASMLKKEFIEVKEYIEALYSDEMESLFSEYIKMAISLKKELKNNDHWVKSSEYIANTLKNIQKDFLEYYNHDIRIDFEYLNTMINEAKDNGNTIGIEENSSEKNVEVISGHENIPEELKNSAKKILDLAKIPHERAKLFWDSLMAFRKIPDKLNTDDDMRKIRRGVISTFFEIYAAVARKVIIDNNTERLYRMFLNYSYMDEKLLDMDQIMSLYKIEDKTIAKNPELHIVNIIEWLNMIYKQEADPSVNGFGQSYKEALREMKKRGMINDEQMTANFESSSKRLEYEISNMISTTQRLCYGQISVYFPILHKDMIIKDLYQSMVKRSGIEKSLEDLLKIDFSAFYREVLYKNRELNLEKELVMQEVYPYFILMPTFGSRAIMWQELSGIYKNSRGRILFPIFTNEDLENLIIPSVGTFRWELCKTILGPAWNDITQMSITSEYSDYVQFYKKNRNLSDEAKEKLQIEIKKCRNNLREVFVSDYILWIKYESKGIMRLNRVARSILYRDVPFSKTIRDILETQPMFSELANRFKNIRRKKSVEVENRYFKFTKKGNPLPKELANNIKFYKEM